MATTFLHGVRGALAKPLRRLLVGAALAGALVTPALAADSDTALTEAQRLAVEKLIDAYIAENPEKIIESVREYNRRQEADRRAQATSNLVALRDELLHDPAAPAAGNPRGDITVVEFFDYRCGYCKRSLDMLMTVLREDNNLRVVFKEFPILSPESRQAARAALASQNQDKYLQFHVALMNARGAFEDEQIFDIAAEVGLDVNRLAADMRAPETEAQLEVVGDLARALNIEGTPAFIVGDRIFRGAIDLDTMRGAIAAARAG